MRITQDLLHMHYLTVPIYRDHAPDAQELACYAE